MATLPGAGVYVSVCVSPACDAEAVVNEAATVPVPSAASFFNANRCAAQSELVTHVAVLFPDGPAAAWTPSAKPAVTFVVPVEETVHSRAIVWPALCVIVTPLATPYAACSISLAAVVVIARPAGLPVAAVPPLFIDVTALPPWSMPLNGSTPLYVTTPPDASALPPAHVNVIGVVSVPSTRCQYTACSIGAAASCAVVPIWFQPLGAVIAPVEFTVTCATITSPATAADGFVMPRLDEPVDVAAVQLVVPPGPAASPHAAMSAIGSIRYGTGRCASSSRSPRIQLDPCRVSDQCAPAGVTSRPCRSRIATGRMCSPTSRPLCTKVTPPSLPMRGTPFVASIRQLHARTPWRLSTVRSSSARLIPNRIDSRPKLVARAAPSR